MSTQPATTRTTPRRRLFFTNVAELQEHLGGIPPDRIRLRPPPGEATEQDVLDAHARDGRICELIDGTLVEKVMASYESLLAGALLHFLYLYLDEHNIGLVLPGDGLLRLFPEQVRVPDVSFISWKRMPNRRFPRDAIASLVPDLAVEILSPSNTEGEMRRKLRDYFQAGCKLVWLVDPEERTVRVYTSVRRFVQFTEEDTLTGGKVLPGFSLAIRTWFARVETGPDQ
jgi:Uma2 family endonuclease